MATSGQTKEELQNLAKDGQFQAHITQGAFQIFLQDDLLDHWLLQFHLLVAMKFVFDRVRPREATVIFPNLHLRYPKGDVKILLKLTRIQHVHEGIRIWVEHLVRKGGIHIGGSDWQAAFRLMPQGYRIKLSQLGDEAHSTGFPATSLQQSMRNGKRKASEEMTEIIESIFTKWKLTQENSNEVLKEIICQKARDLLPRYMERIPLSFAIRNYTDLMTTSYNAGTRVGTSNVAYQTIVDAKETVESGSSSTVNIVIVTGTMPPAYTNILLKAKAEAHRYLCKVVEGRQSQLQRSYGVCFAGLPGTGSGDVWRQLSDQSSSDKLFYEYVELPLEISGSSMHKLLLIPGVVKI
jgi:hypothetical protein